MNHYTYMLVDPFSEMRYVGVRSCKCAIENDSYKGSSSIMTKEEKERCVKLILGVFSTRQDAMIGEIRLHSKLQVLKNTSYWNKAAATSTGHTTLGRSLTVKERQHLSNKMKGRKFTARHKAKLSISQQIRYNEGRGSLLKYFPKGEEHPSRHFKSIYKWKTVYGKVFIGTNLEFRDNISPSATIQSITRVIKGERAQHNGWYIVENMSSNCCTSFCVYTTKFNWVKTDGSTFLGTTTELNDTFVHKPGVGSFNKVASGKRLSAFCWSLKDK